MNVWKAFLAPMFGPQYWHFVVAMIVTAGFMVAGVHAVDWLRGRRDHYHRLGFGVPFTIAAVATPVQFVLGDSIARSAFHKQPVNSAAMEMVWKPGTRLVEALRALCQDREMSLLPTTPPYPPWTRSRIYPRGSRPATGRGRNVMTKIVRCARRGEGDR
ncbi:cytochrome ubiquinol oxidase subunit I [Streptomyces bobili]|uniref:cytochrome ubiquinol oxidase subunit I n=1 Tax=Streptomyces bobili TaxID=67280 RepID=UPI0033B7D3C8